MHCLAPNRAGQVPAQVLGQKLGQESVQQPGQQSARELEPSVMCCHLAAVLVHFVAAAPHPRQWKRLPAALAVAKRPVVSDVVLLKPCLALLLVLVPWAE